MGDQSFASAVSGKKVKMLPVTKKGHQTWEEEEGGRGELSPQLANKPGVNLTLQLSVFCPKPADNTHTHTHTHTVKVCVFGGGGGDYKYL